MQDSDDEVDGQKRKKNSPGRRRRKANLSDSISKDSKGIVDHLTKRPTTSDFRKAGSISPLKKDCKSVCKKRKRYSVKRTKKPKKLLNDIEKCDADDEEKQKDIFKTDLTDGQVKGFVDELSECEENVPMQDLHEDEKDLKSNSPEHQTAESESGK